MVTIAQIWVRNTDFFPFTLAAISVPYKLKAKKSRVNRQYNNKIAYFTMQ